MTVRRFRSTGRVLNRADAVAYGLRCYAAGEEDVMKGVEKLVALELELVRPADGGGGYASDARVGGLLEWLSGRCTG